MPETPAPATPHENDWLRWFAHAVSAALLVLVALVPLGYALWMRLPPKVVTVDLQRLVEDDQTRVVQSMGAESALTPEARAVLHQQTVDFARKLSLAIDQMGQECHCVIINKAALLGGQSIDYTEQVRARMTP